jgi:hypothetical protein
MFHAQNREQAEVVAPGVIREETEALIELRAERLVHERIDSWSEFEATHLTPIDQRYDAQIKAREGELDARAREEYLTMERSKSRMKAIILGAFDKAYYPWMQSHFRFDGSTFDRKFVPHHNRSLERAATLLSQAEQNINVASSDLGIFDVDQRTQRAERKDQIEGDLQALAEVCGRLEEEAKAAVEQRTIWNTVTSEASQIYRPY